MKNKENVMHKRFLLLIIATIFTLSDASAVRWKIGMNCNDGPNVSFLGEHLKKFSLHYKEGCTSKSLKFSQESFSHCSLQLLNNILKVADQLEGKAPQVQLSLSPRQNMKTEWIAYHQDLQALFSTATYEVLVEIADLSDGMIMPLVQKSLIHHLLNNPTKISSISKLPLNYKKEIFSYFFSYYVFAFCSKKYELEEIKTIADVMKQLLHDSQLPSFVKNVIEEENRIRKNYKNESALKMLDSQGGALTILLLMVRSKKPLAYSNCPFHKMIIKTLQKNRKHNKNA